MAHTAAIAGSAFQVLRATWHFYSKVAFFYPSCAVMANECNKMCDDYTGNFWTHKEEHLINTVGHRARWPALLTDFSHDKRCDRWIFSPCYLSSWTTTCWIPPFESVLIRAFVDVFDRCLSDALAHAVLWGFRARGTFAADRVMAPVSIANISVSRMSYLWWHDVSLSISFVVHWFFGLGSVLDICWLVWT